VAVLTTDAAFVGTAIGGNTLGSCRVAFDTIVIAKRRFGRSRSGNYKSCQQTGKNGRCAKGFQQCNRLFHLSSSQGVWILSNQCIECFTMV